MIRTEYRDENGTIRGWIENDVACLPYGAHSGSRVIAFGLTLDKLKEQVEKKVGKK